MKFMQFLTSISVAMCTLSVNVFASDESSTSKDDSGSQHPYRYSDKDQDRSRYGLYLDGAGLPIMMYEGVMSTKPQSYRAYGVGFEWKPRPKASLAISLNQYGYIDHFDTGKFAIRANYYLVDHNRSSIYITAMTALRNFQEKTITDNGIECEEDYSEVAFSGLVGYQWVYVNDWFFRLGGGATTTAYDFRSCPNEDLEYEQIGGPLWGEVLIGVNF